MSLILVIEDNNANMMLAVFLLTQAGHETLVARNAVEGIDLACGRRPDLILIAAQLPDMDGLTITRVLKGDAVAHNIKILVLTTFGIIGNREKIWAAGCDGYITEPICIQDFLKTVENVFRK